MKKQILFFQNQSNNLSKRTKSLPKLAMAFVFFMCFTTLSFSQTIVDCSAGPVNTTYCYVNNDTTQFVFTSTGGFPLNVYFNAGQVEVTYDELIVLDSDGVTDLNAATPYGNNGDLTGITYQSSGDTITIMIDSDSVISCETNAFTPWDFDIWCQTCINPAVEYAVYGDCEDEFEFFVDVTIDDLGTSTSLLIEDDQGNSQTANDLGTFTFGPYVPFEIVNITVTSLDDPNCVVNSGNLTYSCIVTGACALLDAGPDVTLTCDDNCTDLEATVLALPLTTTSSYSIQGPICDLPPISGGDPTGLVIDDEWSNSISIPFDFNYFQNDYNQLVVGANGQVSFDTSLAGQYSGWAIEPNELLPITAANFPLNTIYGAFHDIDPSVNSDPDQINYFTTGTAPYRIFVINFNMVPQFSCNELLTTQQILLYETLNVIDVNLINKPVCANWNDGLATLGLMGNNLSEFNVPPDRNTGVWEVTNENWRFVPNGDPSIDTTFEWLDGSGTVVGTTLEINVCPTETTTYTASLTVVLPDGSTNTITDDVLVELGGLNVQIDLGEDQLLCDQTPFEIIPEITGDITDATYLWSPNGETTPTITVTTPGTYTLEITILDCTAEDSITIDYIDSPIIELGEDFNTCFELEVLLDASPSNMDPATASYEWSLDGVIIPSEISPTLIITQLGTYSVIVSAGNCSTEDSIIVNPGNDLGVELGEGFNTCFVDPIILDATPSIGDPSAATYEWTLDGVILPDTTATLDATTHGTYLVTVNLNGCTDTDSITFTPLGDLGIELGDDFTTCFSTPVLLDASPSIGDPNTATYEWSLDGVTLPNTTATLDATAHGTYLVTVNLNGCTDTDSITLTPLGDLGVDLGSDLETCFVQQVTLDATPTLGDPSDATYVWSLDGLELANETSSTINATQYGVYSVVVSIGDCTDEDSMTTSGRDDLIVTLGNDIQTCPDISVTLTAVTDEEGVSYQWSLDDVEIPSETSATLEASEQGTYTVTITTGQCTGSSSVEVYYYDNEGCVISQGLSPHNYDGYNDYLDLRFLDDRAGISKFQVFNRLGTLVFDRNSYRREWTGQSNEDKILPTGTYYYVIDFVSEDPVYGNQASGWVYVNREKN